MHFNYVTSISCVATLYCVYIERARVCVYGQLGGVSWGVMFNKASIRSEQRTQEDSLSHTGHFLKFSFKLIHGTHGELKHARF